MKEPRSLSSDTLPWIIITPLLHRSRGWWEIITQNKVDPHGELSPQDQNGLPPSPVETTTKKFSHQNVSLSSGSTHHHCTLYWSQNSFPTLLRSEDGKNEDYRTVWGYLQHQPVQLLMKSLISLLHGSTWATLDTWSLWRLTQVQTGRQNRERKLECEMKKEVQALGMIKVMKLLEFK